MIKTVLRISQQQQVLMQSLRKTLNKCSRKCFKIKIQNQIVETTINPHLLHKDKILIAYPLPTSGLMASHKIFARTANIANVRKKATN